MQCTSEPERRLLDAAALVGHLVPPGSVYAFLAEHRQRLFPDELFADLFGSGRGRPSVPADEIATVMVLQSLEGLSDRDAVQALRTDLRWKVAAGLPLDDEGFHPTVLTLWRNKLRTSDRPQRIFDAVRDVVAATGVLTGKTRRALDSTLLDDAVATQDTVTQLVSMIRRVRRAIPAAATVTVTAHDYEASGKPRIAWDDDDARQQLVTALVVDARTTIDALEGVGLDDEQADHRLLLDVDDHTVVGDGVEDGAGVVDESGDQLVTGGRVIPRTRRLASRLVVVSGDVRCGRRRDGAADPTNHRHQLRHRVLRGDRVVEQRRVERSAGLAGQHPSRRHDVTHGVEDPFRTVARTQLVAPQRQHRWMDILTVRIGIDAGTAARLGVRRSFGIVRRRPPIRQLVPSLQFAPISVPPSARLNQATCALQQSP